ncbi:hypothetical protein RHGRI_006915 [Rhododendron griersonianum]|uniref:Transcription repressor n=1 Tax=Rhododendron griersonianum TaxID=479676 RepID=A0AAV6KX12_9ERIC|nr:hypothetical protein RHGRI_006915 [Rhododendron griersonianum]
MSSGNRRRLRLSTVTVNLGCSSSCRRPKLSSIFRPKPKPSKPSTTNNNPYYSSCSVSATSPPVYYSDAESDDDKSLKSVQGFGRLGGESVAVEKDSDDPYLDFRRSMLQMILENEIYSKEDLKELLNCFLQLNSPYYHGIIVRAFSEIWNGVFSVKAAGGKSRAF